MGKEKKNGKGRERELNALNSHLMRTRCPCALRAGLQPFRLHDFSWEDQAYAVVGRYCPGIERLLDDMFRETLSLTDFT